MTEHHNGVVRGVVNIVVIGGGYAGVMAANHLRLDPRTRITLVNPRTDFVERIRLHQYVTGSDDAVVDFGSVLGEGIRLVVDAATRIDAAARRVDLASGETLDYDYLVYAVGSTGAALGVPGAADHAYPVSEYEHAEPLRAAVAGVAADAPIVVVGAGPTGSEMAAELDYPVVAETPLLDELLAKDNRPDVAGDGTKE